MSNVVKKKYAAARVLFSRPTDLDNSGEQIMKDLQKKAADKWGFNPSTGRPIENHPRWEYEKMATINFIQVDNGLDQPKDWGLSDVDAGLDILIYRYLDIHLQ